MADKITTETKAELRRLHAASATATKARKESRFEPGDEEWYEVMSAEDLALGALEQAMTAHLIPLLDALAAAEAERDRLLEQTETMRSALIQARGALRLDAMVDRDGNPYGTTGVALEAIDAALGAAEEVTEDDDLPNEAMRAIGTRWLEQYGDDQDKAFVAAAVYRIMRQAKRTPEHYELAALRAARGRG